MAERNEAIAQSHAYLIIPAYNEQARIGRTLDAYDTFLSYMNTVDTTQWRIHVVLNGCTDNTYAIVDKHAQRSTNITYENRSEPGKGRAVRHGFAHALDTRARYIGFVDADMATDPEAFWQLYQQLGAYDGAIASRYMSGAQITPQRPWYKRWGSRLVYEPLVRMVLGISYHDYQCGAKLFRADALASALPHLVVNGWAFDIELLHVLHQQGKKVCEVPTRWVDRAGSKINVWSGFSMLRTIFSIARHHVRRQ